jgi:hypothetical protein
MRRTRPPLPAELESANKSNPLLGLTSPQGAGTMPDVQLPPVDDEGHSNQVASPRRTKSFFKIGLEVALISAGVFLGMLGDEWRENAEHQALADASLLRFRAEFRANKAEVERVHGRHVQQLQALEKYFAEHQAALLDVRQPPPPPIPDMATDSAGVAYAAWDVALATQSLAYIDPDLVAATSSAYRLQHMYEDAHRHIQQAQYSANMPIHLMRGHMTYFGDASLYEELLLKQYDAILSRLDKAVGE